MIQRQVTDCCHIGCQEEWDGGGVLVVRLEGKTALESSRCRWEDNIKKDLQEGGWGSMDWITLAQDRDKRCVLVNVVMNLWVPQHVWDLLTRWFCQDGLCSMELCSLVGCDIMQPVRDWCCKRICCFHCLPWLWKQQVALKHQHETNRLHGNTSRRQTLKLQSDTQRFNPLFVALLPPVPTVRCWPVVSLLDKKTNCHHMI